MLSRFRLLLPLLVFMSPSGVAKAASGNSANAHGNPGAQVIQHVIIMFQENRSTDNMFHGLTGVDTADCGINSKGQKIQLQPIHLVNSYDLGHAHAAGRQSLAERQVATTRF